MNYIIKVKCDIAVLVPEVEELAKVFNEQLESIGCEGRKLDSWGHFADIELDVAHELSDEEKDYIKQCALETISEQFPNGSFEVYYFRSTEQALKTHPWDEEPKELDEKDIEKMVRKAVIGV